MGTSYTGIGSAPVGTLTCDGCGATWTDGVAETAGQGGLLQRAYEKARWELHRPNPHQGDTLCPACYAVKSLEC